MKKLLLAAALSVAASAGQAQNIKASDPNGLFDYFKDQGIAAQLEIDSYGDPLINILYYGTRYFIYFYGCTDGSKCTAIQFFVGYETNGSWPKDEANAWNTAKRYTRAYVNDEGASRLEYDIYTGETGIGRDDFENMLTIWSRAMGNFEEAIGW